VIGLSWLLLLVTALGFYVWLIEPQWLRISRYVVPLPMLPTDSEPVRVVHLTDLHGRVRTLWGKSLARIVNRIGPDIPVPSKPRPISGFRRV
jgi:predicted MPP superfamily phosphohydrolase